MASDLLSSEVSPNGTAIIILDDGKVNAISPLVLAAFRDMLDAVEADREVTAVVLAGREGQFSAGFDLASIMAGGEARNDLVTGGWDLLIRLVEFPKPLVIACTGNAVAAGAALLLTGDVRLGTDGDFKIGLNEVPIGLPLPGTVAALAEARIVGSELFAATAAGRLYPPRNAVAAGYLHEVVGPGEVVGRAAEAATALGRLPQLAFASTKRAIAQATVVAMRDRISADQALLEQIGG